MAKPEHDFISFQEGIERIQDALASLGVPRSSLNQVITSRDPIAERLRSTLRISKLPAGFEKWQLPVYFEGTGAQFFVTVAQGGAKVDEHAHADGHAIRFVAGGAIRYGGQELTAGDWMFIPKDVPYSFEVGPHGAVMCYCYQCCCVPK